MANVNYGGGSQNYWQRHFAKRQSWGQGAGPLSFPGQRSQAASQEPRSAITGQWQQGMQAGARAWGQQPYQPYNPATGGAPGQAGIPTMWSQPTAINRNWNAYDFMREQQRANAEARARSEMGAYRAESALSQAQQQSRANPITQAAQQSILQRLQSPYSMNQETQQAMIQRTQDRLNEQRDLARQQLSADLARRGLTSSGSYGAGFANIEKEYARSLGDVSRDVEIQGALQGQQVLGAAQQMALGASGQQYGQQMGMAQALAQLLGSQQFVPEDYMTPLAMLLQARQKLSIPTIRQG